MTPLRPALPRVLSIAGTDPSGGAGTAADTKSISAAGGFAMTAVTCLVAQNTTGVQAVHTPPSDFLSQQLRSVSDDVELDAVKTGMLGTTEIITAVGAWLDENPPAVLVVDPVMVATSGDRLLEPEAEEAMRRFCERATVITPNIPELAVLQLSEEQKKLVRPFAIPIPVREIAMINTKDFVRRNLRTLIATEIQQSVPKDMLKLKQVQQRI